MFSTIFKQELKYWFNKPAFYIYLSIFLVLSFFLAATSAGLFDSNTATVGSSRIVNSPISIYSNFIQKLSVNMFENTANIYNMFQNVCFFSALQTKIKFPNPNLDSILFWSDIQFVSYKIEKCNFFAYITPVNNNNKIIYIKFNLIFQKILFVINQPSS